MTGYKHGFHGTKAYRAWQQAKKRCLNPRDKDYPSYGGRGITFAPEWHQYEAFHRDMGACPDGFTLGRKDNDQGYCKSNCEWQSLNAQARNKRNTFWLTVNGVTKAIADWADEAGISIQTIRKRVEAGWSHEKAVATEVKKTKASTR